MLLHVWFRDQSMYTREPEVRKDQFCISWWLLISDGSHFMASQFHFVAIRMTSNACHSWWLTGSFTLTITITFQLSLISEIIASEKGGADNTDNISVWSILQYPQEFYRSPIQWQQRPSLCPCEGLGCNKFMRTTNPLALSNSQCFCLDCQNSCGDWATSLMVAFIGVFFTCQIQVLDI